MTAASAGGTLPAASLRCRSSRARPRAKTPSVPGTMTIQRSALAPVNVIFGLDLHQHTPVGAPAKPRILPRGGDRRFPGAEKIIAERQDHAGAVDQRHGIIHAEHPAVD